MSYLNRPYESNYYEADREVIREGPYGNYSAEYRIDEYGNRVPHHNYNQNQHHQNGVAGVVKEIVSEVMSGGHKHNHNNHHHHGPTEYIERREERIVDSTYDPYRRMY
ncbi:uncharacterized protein LOC110722673 [Chenopodium quinoa]|uniref:uncharacterized protein LOC110722673 n=1 Tax=Chenopodium quinoa TaxID=63459 RepID=UPI000B786A7E|nr:uncharacterized protein LOC110722673 [Chenopodium quinoa]